MRASYSRRTAIRALLGFLLAFGLSATAQAAANSAEQETIATARIEPSSTNAAVMPTPFVAKHPASGRDAAERAAGPMTANAQIDAYLRASPTTPWEDAEALDRQEDRPARQIHGQVGVAVGTGGYRSAYVQSDIPVGRDGNLSIFVQETQFGRGHGHGYDSGYGYGAQSGRSLGLSLDLSGPARAAGCRQDSWDRTAQRGEPGQSRLNRCVRPGRPFRGGNEP